MTGCGQRDFRVLLDNQRGFRVLNQLFRFSLVAGIDCKKFEGLRELLRPGRRKMSTRLQSSRIDAALAASKREEEQQEQAAILPGPLPLTDAAAQVIRPEIEYRLRFLVQEALKLAKHSNRTKLLPVDIATAYNTWSRAKATPFRYVERGQKAATAVAPSRCSIREEPLRVYRSLHELLGE